MARLTEHQNRAIARKWGQAPESAGYWSFPPLWPYFIACAFGSDAVDAHRANPWWAQDLFIERHLQNRKVESILSLCCGHGTEERYWIGRLGTVRRCLAIDLAAEAVRHARQAAVEQKLDRVLTYEMADLNTYDWSRLRGQFDLVVAGGALHHLEALETVLTGIREALTEDGVLYAVECIGPSQQDHTPRQLELINALGFLVPPAMRCRKAFPFRHRHAFLRKLWVLRKILRGEVDPGAYDDPAWSVRRKAAALLARKIRRYRRPPATFEFGILHDSQKPLLQETDPSEGVRSADILPVMRSVFGEVDIRFLGGALLPYALDSAFYAHFDDTNAAHIELLERLCALEQFFLKTGQVQQEYALLVAERQ